MSTLFTRRRLFKLFAVITEQNTCVAHVEATECPAAAGEEETVSEFGPESVAPFPPSWTPLLVPFFEFLSSTVYELLGRTQGCIKIMIFDLKYQDSFIYLDILCDIDKLSRHVGTGPSIPHSTF